MASASAKTWISVPHENCGWPQSARSPQATGQKAPDREPPEEEDAMTPASPNERNLLSAWHDFVAAFLRGRSWVNRNKTYVVVLLFGAVGEHHAIGLCELGDLPDPSQKARMVGRSGVQTRNGR